MDRAFIAAFRPESQTVCGLRLKPFSLAHILELEHVRSPFCALWNESVPVGEIAPRQTYRAAQICADRLPSWRRLDGLRAYSYPAEASAIALAQYITAHMQCPEVWSDSDSGGTVNAPWLLAKAVYLMANTTLTQFEIWHMPVGQVMWYAAAVSEQCGGAQILSESEREIINEIERSRREESKK